MKYIPTNDVFIDSNLWIYLSVSTKDKEKHNSTLSFFEQISNKYIYTSIQVINEYHWVMLRKYKLSESDISEKVENGIIQMSKIVDLNINTYKKAQKIRANYNISFWDSLIVSSALLSNCSILYSEDMDNDLVIENKIKIINPLLQSI